MKVGVLFPGQGTQHSGMGKYWYQHERIAQECFEEASACLSFNVAKLCFSTSSSELKKTVNAQIGIFVVSTALHNVLKEYTGIEPTLVAGHSSGEYTAVHAAGALSFPDALFLVQRRAMLMQEATTRHDGAMLAVLGLTVNEVRAVCATFDRPRTFTHVAQLASHNGPKHTVVACSQALTDQLLAALRAAGGRAMALPVGGGFHSRFMASAQDALQESFVQVAFRKPHIPVVSNQDAKLLVEASQIEHDLRGQICAPVRWWPSMSHFLQCDIVIQVGPGKTFSNILRRHWPEKKVFSFNDQGDLGPIMQVVQAWQTSKEEDETWQDNDH